MEETYKLSDLMNAVSNTIEVEFGGPYWITAEIAAAHNKNKGYWVLELQESDAKGKKLAQTQAMVWSQHVPKVIYQFQNVTGQKLSSGMKVRIFVEASFHPQWGFRLTVSDIDTSFTLGEAKANNEKIKNNLISLGIWDLNKKLNTPKDFFNIAIISPDTSAGLEDFLREAELLKLYGLLNYDVYNAPFEGENAIRGIPQAINKINKSGKNYDAVCIVRGGGAASGIAWINQEAIIKSVCECIYPVISGIGHERDTTLVDEVANIVCGTPSKTIGYISSTIIQNAQATNQNWISFNKEIEQRLTLARKNLNDQLISVKDLSLNLISKAKIETASLFREAISISPSSTLERGYTLIQDKNGKVIKSINEIKDNEIIINFKDGKKNALIVDKINKKKAAKNKKEKNDE